MRRKGILLIGWFLLTLSVMAQKSGSNKPAPKAPEYIMHVVKFGETLTKIAQKYDVSKTEILKSNPSLVENSIFPDQIIRVPNIHKKQILNNSKPAASTQEVKVSVNPVSQTGIKMKEHVVEPKQTLYGISKMYQVSIDDLKKWNNLPDNNVKIGMVLKVASTAGIIPVAPSAAATPPPVQASVIPAESGTSVQAEETTTEIPEKPDVQAIENESQKSLLAIYKKYAATATAKGTGAPMTTTLGAMENVYFAMHKTLPIGTVIKIKNLVNSKIIYAKVIGTLPETDENKHVIVRYSMGVKKELQLQNGKCYVQIEYPK
ncbi:MAG TPA: LysM peptidoglycan-binding domain-containing protein [Chitinophagales bacterium]|jgi:LysM repeat protein|nr:LysM peptidoglycan-binding domain-containing protein [Chitinophagales bacterium]